MELPIKYFGLENFRVFKDRTDFDFAWITILTGTNSSGKSSLIKAILLLKSNSNITPNNREISKLKFGLDLKMGNINTAKNNKMAEKPMVFYFPIAFDFTQDEHILALKFQDDKYQDHNGEIVGLEVINKNQKTVLYSFNKRHNQSVIQVDFWELLKNSNLIINNEQQQFLKDLSKDTFIPVESPGGDYFITKLEWVLESVIKKMDDNLFENTVALKKELNDTLIQNFKMAIQEVNEINAMADFIPSIRNNVQRRFENKVSDYFTSVVENQKRQSSNHATAFVQKYFSQFDIGLDFRIEMEKDSMTYAFEIRNKNEELINLVDLGYGISQVLPIILKLGCLIYENYNDFGVNEFQDSLFEPTLESSILIIEEPETNLHPRLQSKLADMFAEAATKYSIQFIIETHSEYLIRKLQYLTAKGEIQPEDTQIYYFYPPEHPDVLSGKEPQVKKINIRKDGILTEDFGDGFFDESVRWTFELLKLQNLN